MKVREKGKKTESVSGFLIGKERSKKTLLFMLVPLGIVLVIGIGLFANQRLVSNNQCRGGNSSPLYNQAAKELEAPRSDGLKIVVEKIQKQKNYKQDKNCLYPVVAYYLAAQDLTKVNEYLPDLEKAAGKDASFASAYSKTQYPSLDKLKAGVAWLVELDKKRDGSSGTLDFY